VRAAQAYPSLILRSSFAQPSLKVRLKKGRDDAISKEVKNKTLKENKNVQIIYIYHRAIVALITLCSNF
jgi:hypothetical protein